MLLAPSANDPALLSYFALRKPYAVSPSACRLSPLAIASRTKAWGNSGNVFPNARG